MSQLFLDRFSSNTLYMDLDPRERGEGFRTASEALLNLRDISPVTIQACVLLGAYASAHGDTDVENVYYSTAGRMCLVLDLPNRPVASLLEREVNIRGMFSLIGQVLLPHSIELFTDNNDAQYGGRSAWSTYGLQLLSKSQESCPWIVLCPTLSTRSLSPQ